METNDTTVGFWNSDCLKDWSIVGMNHYHVKNLANYSPTSKSEGSNACGGSEIMLQSKCLPTNQELSNLITKKIKDLTDLNKIAGLRDNLFMKGGNTDEEKKYYSMGYISGLQDSGMVKALEYWKQRCEAAELMYDKLNLGIGHTSEYAAWLKLKKAEALAGINETKEK